MKRRHQNASKWVFLLSVLFVGAAHSGSYYYNPLHKVDPFYRPEIKPAPVIQQGNSPLEFFETSTIQLVGVMSSPRSMSALLLTPDPKYGAILTRTGDRVGKFAGKIISITRDKVVVRENLPQVGGTFKVNDVVLELNRKEPTAATTDGAAPGAMGIQPPRSTSGFANGIQAPTNTLANPSLMPANNVLNLPPAAPMPQIPAFPAPGNAAAAGAYTTTTAPLPAAGAPFAGTSGQIPPLPSGNAQPPSQPAPGAPAGSGMFKVLATATPTPVGN